MKLILNGESNQFSGYWDLKHQTKKRLLLYTKDILTLAFLIKKQQVLYLSSEFMKILLLVSFPYNTTNSLKYIGKIIQVK